MNLPLNYQASLLDNAAQSSPDRQFKNLRRFQLDESSWLDYAPSWLSGSDALFRQLVSETPWVQSVRKMYDRVITEPRLTWYRKRPKKGLHPKILEEMAEILSQRYQVEFNSVGLNYYRDGNDSVAWHGDRITRAIPEPIVALVSLGEARKLLYKPRVGGQARSFLLGHGDLLVTGGKFQRQWLHNVPKTKQAGPRISIGFRHSLLPAKGKLANHRVS